MAYNAVSANIRSGNVSFPAGTARPDRDEPLLPPVGEGSASFGDMVTGEAPVARVDYGSYYRGDGIMNVAQS